MKNKKYVVINLWNNETEYEFNCVNERCYPVVHRILSNEEYYGTLQQYLKKYPNCNRKLLRTGTKRIYDSTLIMGEKLLNGRVRDLITGKIIIPSKNQFSGKLAYKSIVPITPQRVKEELEKLTKEDIKRYGECMQLIERISSDVLIRENERIQREKINQENLKIQVKQEKRLKRKKNKETRDFITDFTSELRK